MSDVICNSIGSTPHCKGCGASVPHYHLGCEQCPVNPNAKCIPVESINKDSETPSEVDSVSDEFIDFDDEEDDVFGYECLGCGNIQDHGGACDRCDAYCVDPMS